ncbi:MAG TPA: ABC transporter permease [Clostridiaceae bacterium]|nr:ABC transporter permease [Clostridiaceae bacterium]
MTRRFSRLTFPYIIWMLVFTIVPLLLVAFFAFTAYDQEGNLFFTWQGFNNIFSGSKTSLNWLGLHTIWGLDIQVPLYISVFLKSLSIAVVATIISLLFGYPVAWLLAKLKIAKKRSADFLLFLTVMPMWMNALLRTYAWLALLEPTGIINTFLKTLGIGPIQFLYNDFGIGLGMVYNYLPFMILPIYSVLVKIDPALLEAAGDLGADNTYTLRKVIIPLSLPGVYSGINMVLMPAMTTFLIPDLLGGGRYLLIGNAIQRQYMISRDYTTGSALTILLLIFVLISMSVVNRNSTEMSEAGGLI